MSRIAEFLAVSLVAIAIAIASVNGAQVGCQFLAAISHDIGFVR